jgi:hypothetical protein
MKENTEYSKLRHNISMELQKVYSEENFNLLNNKVFMDEYEKIKELLQNGINLLERDLKEVNKYQKNYDLCSDTIAKIKRFNDSNEDQKSYLVRLQLYVENKVKKGDYTQEVCKEISICLNHLGVPDDNSVYALEFLTHEKRKIEIGIESGKYKENIEDIDEKRLEEISKISVMDFLKSKLPKKIRKLGRK